MANQERPVALVTGASSGFGLLTALALARAGYRTIATLRNPLAAAPLIAQARQADVADGLETMTLDVTDHAAIERTVQTVIGRWGRIDVLINNAGYAAGGFIEEVPMTAWREQLETNLLGVIATTQAVLPTMRAQGSGCIVNVSSVSGRLGLPGYGPYNTSKFAVEGFSESLRLEMRPFGVRVVLVEPGAYRTPIWQKGFASMHAAPGSPYAPFLARVLAYSQRTAANAPDPQQVADRIVRIVKARRPRLRYPMGRGSRLGPIARGLLPWRWFEAMIWRLLKGKA